MHRRIYRRHGRRIQRRRAGFSLLETMIAMVMLFVSMAGILSAYLNCLWEQQVNTEEARARNAAEQVLSALRGMPDLVEAYQRFGGGGPEETFAVRGLQGPSVNDAAGRVIVWRRKDSLKNRVTPPQPDPGSAMFLSQSDLLAAQQAFSSTFPAVLDTAAGMTGTGWNDFLDTNGNGTVDITDDPQVMPVTVRIRWRTRSGIRTHYFSAVIGRR